MTSAGTSRLMTLTELRTNRGFTQSEVGRLMRVTQQRIAQLEDRGVSSTTVRSLDRYVTCMGGRLDLVITFPDGEELHL